MGNIPETVNPTAAKVDTVISISASAGETLVEGLIIADVPWLGLPGIKQIWEALFNWIMGYVVKAAQTGATFAVIDAQVSSELSNVSTAMAALIAAEKTGNANAIKIALQNYADYHSNLIHDDGS